MRVFIVKKGEQLQVFNAVNNKMHRPSDDLHAFFIEIFQSNAEKSIPISVKNKLRIACFILSLYVLVNIKK